MAILTPALLLLAACADPSVDARTAWLHEAFYVQDATWVSRPELALKYDAMQQDPYDYLRGSAGVWYADLARPHAGREPTTLVADAREGAVLLFGDPHPENLSTCRAGDAGSREQTVEFVDLDGATYGPWPVDLRRAALGLAMLVPPDCACDEVIVEGLVRGYEDGLAGRAIVYGRILDDLLVDAVEEGTLREKLDRLAPVGDNGRAIALSESLTAPSTEERSRAGRLLAPWAEDRGLRVLEVAKQHAVGVASIPAERFLVRFDRGDDGPDDDDLVQLREVLDAPLIPGLDPPLLGRFADNASRIDAARALWSRPDADALADGISDDGLSYKTSAESSWFKGIDHVKVAADLADGDLTPGDIAALAAAIGRVLATGHSGAPGADGLPAGDVIRASFDAATAEPELVRLVASDRARLLDDAARFAALRDTYGPVLGFDAP